MVGVDCLHIAVPARSVASFPEGMTLYTGVQDPHSVISARAREKWGWWGVDLRVLGSCMVKAVGCGKPKSVC